MTKFPRASLLIFLLCAAVLGCLRMVANEDRISNPLARAHSLETGTHAMGPEIEKTFFAAVARGDRDALAKLLEANFEFTNAEGATRTKRDIVQILDDLRRVGPETEVTPYSYDNIVVISGVHRNAHFMRVWAKRGDGWHAVAFIDTPISRGTAPFSVASQKSLGDCENPCRTMPYKPITAADRTVAALFQRLKADEWHPNPEDWAPYVLDGVPYVTSNASLTKEERVAHLTDMKRTGATAVPGDPVRSMRILDFENAAVMITLHVPYLGGKPYRSIRVWLFRSGRWQLANSQQTTITSAPAVPSFAPKQPGN
jgi:hypothetical protein